MLLSLNGLSHCQTMDNIRLSYTNVLHNQDVIINLIKQLKTRGLRIQFNQDISLSKITLLAQIRASNWGRNTLCRIQYNISDSNGYNIGLIVRTFPSRAAFERSPYCRGGTNYRYG